MNKDKIKSRVNQIKSKEDFDDIVSILSEYPSIKERVSKLKFSSIMIFTKSPISINNTSNVKSTLNTIIDDYKFRNDILPHFKTIYDRFIDAVKIFIK